MVKRNKEGMVAIEIVVASVIFILFFITTIYTERNFNNKYVELKARTNASKVAVDEMEKMLLNDYEAISGIEEKKVTKDNITYDVTVDVIKYSDENQGAKDLVKTIIVNVDYVFNEKPKNFNLKTVTTRMW